MWRGWWGVLVWCIGEGVIDGSGSRIGESRRVWAGNSKATSREIMGSFWAAGKINTRTVPLSLFFSCCLLLPVGTSSKNSMPIFPFFAPWPFGRLHSHSTPLRCTPLRTHLFCRISRGLRYRTWRYEDARLSSQNVRRSWRSADMKSKLWLQRASGKTRISSSVIRH